MQHDTRSGRPRWHIPAVIVLALTLATAGFVAVDRPADICGVVVATDRTVSLWYADDCPVWTRIPGGAEIDTTIVANWRGVLPPTCDAVGVLRMEGEPLPRVVPLACGGKSGENRDGNGTR